MTKILYWQNDGVGIADGGDIGIHDFISDSTRQIYSAADFYGNYYGYTEPCKLIAIGNCFSRFFTNKLFHKLSHSIAGLFLVIAVSLSGAGIIHFLPSQLAFAGWMLPPVYRVMDVLNNYETSSESEIVLAILLPGLYSILMFSIFLMWMKKKLF
jgi:hypothetical protein